MALIHAGTVLTPPKLDLIAAWLPGQPWSAGADGRPIESIGTYRFDDPGGKVGIDTIVARTANGRILQIPVTYREAPLAGAGQHLIGTTHHSVLGMRWIYDGCADPVWVTATVNTILTGGREAMLDVQSDDGSHEVREATTNVRGSGGEQAIADLATVNHTSDADATTIQAGQLRLVVRRTLDSDDTDFDADARHTLSGRWPGLEKSIVLAAIR